MSGLLFIKTHYYSCMKRFLTLVLTFIFLSSVQVMADDVDFSSSITDFWNIEHPDLDREVKPVSDEEFDKAIEQVDAKVNKWKNRVERWKKPKGEAFSQGNETEEIQNETTDKDTHPVICIPVPLKINDGIIPIGHYQVRGEENNGTYTLNLYQAHNLMAKIPAILTNDDFNEEEILFVKLIPENDEKIKIIYGSLDFNAYAYLNVFNENDY